MGERAARRLEATVDYRDVVACVREVSDGRAFQLLERLASALADELNARFPVTASRFASASRRSSSTGGRAAVTAER